MYAHVFMRVCLCVCINMCVYMCVCVCAMSEYVLCVCIQGRHREGADVDAGSDVNDDVKDKSTCEGRVAEVELT